MSITDTDSCFIQGDKIHKYHCQFNDFNYYIYPKYDSVNYDLMNCYGVDSLRLQFSSKFSNIPELRLKDSVFNQHIMLRKDIKTLQLYLNKSSLIKRIKNEKVMINIIKQIIKITQIQLLNSNFNAYDFNEAGQLIKCKNIYEIKDEDDFEIFKKGLKSSYINCKDTIFGNWQKNNIQYLQKKCLSVVQEKIYQDEYFICYTLPDYKLFIFKIKRNNNFFELQKTHLNKEYLWEDVYFHLPLDKHVL